MPQPGHSMASTSKRRVSSRAKPTVVDTEVEEPGSMSMLWKEAFPVGTEWDQYDKVYEIDWDFSNLEEAFEEGGKLHGQRVYLFGCTEPQLIHFKDASRVIHIPAVVAVTSPFPPSDKIGIKSIQREDELIVPMKEMKMGWVPYLPPQVREYVQIFTPIYFFLWYHGGGPGCFVVLRVTCSYACYCSNSAVERYKAQVFTLKCTQRRAALKQLKQERIKKYEYCLPYIYSPLKEDETIDETVVNIMYPMEDDAKPPVVTEFDWQFDEVEEFTDNLIKDEELPAGEKEKFQKYLKDAVAVEKKKVREAKLARKKALDDMSKEVKEGFESMRFYKFYPVKSEHAPDITEVKAAFINRYYGRATEVL